MGWARLDDSFHDHPKVDGLSLAAVGLYVLCLTWAHRHRRTAVVPGHITVARARKVAGAKMPALTAELVRTGLWELHPDGWVIHDFADYLPKERDPAELSTAGRKGAASRWQSDGKLPSASHDSAMQTDGKAMAEGMANDGSCASAPAFPSRPVPSQPQTPNPVVAAQPRNGPDKPAKTTAARGTRIPDRWPLDSDHAEKIRAWATEHAPAVFLRAETENWQDWHRAKGDTAKDWNASWRTWMRRAQADTERRAGPGSHLTLAGRPARPSASEAAANAALEAGARVAARHAAQEGA